VSRPEKIVREEGRLFKQAESLPARLPCDEIDLLIIDRVGKSEMVSVQFAAGLIF
jgi:hypothetical protein